jgi:hypothetical protein
VFHASAISAFRFNPFSNVYVIEGRNEVMGRRGRRRKQLLDGRKETKRYWKLKEEALDRAPKYSDLKIFTWSKSLII